jgi:hypothetical protein
MGLLVLALLAGTAGFGAAEPSRLSPSIEADADYLLTTPDFMDAQFGMSVDAVEQTPSDLLVRTTGAEFVFEPDAGLLHLRQRLGAVREVATVSFPPGVLGGIRVRQKGSGAVLLATGRSRLRLRINADSLLMLKTASALSVACETHVAAGTLRQYGANVLMLDERGGFGSYVAAGPPTAPAIVDGSAIRQELAAGNVLWLSVAPPRPYDWEASFRDRVAWHWSTETGYPSDAQIQEWSRYANLLLQQSEVMLWKDWSLRFIPRFGIEEFRRVNETCARYGMRNFVYTSPFYFLTGTGLESKAMNSFDNFAETGFSPGDGRGLNWPIFLSEITKVMREYKPAGLYFDGIYDNVVRTYLITRKAREVVGDTGLLEYHATGSPPGGGVYLPQIDTWFNFILRGEGAQSQYENDDYLRYYVSTWNISNSIGVLCNNNDYPLTEAFVGKLLDNNIRLHYLCDKPGTPRLEAMETLYWPALTPALRDRVEKAAVARAEAAKRAQAAVREAEAKGIEGLKLAFQEDFEDADFLAMAPTAAALPNGWRAVFSPNSQGQLKSEGGVLTITALSNTCAYLERDLPKNAVAVQGRFRCLAEGGMSWGPGLLLRVGDTWRRLNVRGDDRIGVDRADTQVLLDGYPSDTWYWLRLRLAGEVLCCEVSRDGAKWRIVRTENLGRVHGPRSLVVGKIDNGGQGVEYRELGAMGAGQVADVRVYATP